MKNEILLVGGLVAAVVLLFLGLWRSTMIVLPAELRAEKKHGDRKPGGIFRIHHAIEHGVDRMAETQGKILRFILRRKILILLPVLFAAALGVFAVMKSGREFFPKTDAGLIRLFVRIPSGVRIEDTAQVMADIQREIRGLIPKEELQFVVENIGTPSSINQAWVETTAISSSDGEGGVFDTASGTMRAEFLIDNKDLLLHAGFTGLATFKLSPVPGTFTLPTNTLLVRQGKTMVGS